MPELRTGVRGRRPVVALLTDFGVRDHYVAAMKGVVLGICPDASLVDITHEIPPQDVLAAALELAAAYRFFPPSTVFLAVVDPGVGSGRRAVAVAAGGYRFVAPDNGLLTAVLHEHPPSCSVELTERRYALAEVSRTFEGRDRFAPAAAWLARGLACASLGRSVEGLATIDIPAPSVEGSCLTGVVLRVDRFGNLITSIDRSSLERFMSGREVRIEAGECVVHPLVAAYAEAPPDGVCALVGSTGHLEIAWNGGSAHAHLGLARGAPVRIFRLPA